MFDAATASPIRRRESVFVDASDRLRRLYPECPRVYAVAAMADQGKRRWWRLQPGLDGGRIEKMYARASEEMLSNDAAAVAVATSLIHAIVGRVVASVVLDGRAWDPGIENLWIHMDSDGGIDWAGVDDTTIRVLPDDVFAGDPGTVTLPCEEALFVWLAHRCITSLDAVLERLDECVDFDRQRFWSIVGEAIVGAATYVPILANSAESRAARRGQGILDAMTAVGVPVRRERVA
ncbi:hypothetical protein [Antrihabitans cavernicola]|uniref:Iron reductase n=1 Tax=Antrihabitans cavernicola TaxID=2495913 RepID=A0A5A7S793_9NOCA|nr:hypothetical protein [Spelaeibacter cavernicola]KAA0020048.1 hypothetical protein FOY51_22055 [Spelaeibacter cavernicola]